MHTLVILSYVTVLRYKYHSVEYIVNGELSRVNAISKDHILKHNNKKLKVMVFEGKISIKIK